MRQCPRAPGFRWPLRGKRIEFRQSGALQEKGGPQNILASGLTRLNPPLIHTYIRYIRTLYTRTQSRVCEDKEANDRNARAMHADDDADCNFDVQSHRMILRVEIATAAE